MRNVLCVVERENKSKTKERETRKRNKDQRSKNEASTVLVGREREKERTRGLCGRSEERRDFFLSVLVLAGGLEHMLVHKALEQGSIGGVERGVVAADADLEGGGRRMM